MSPQPKVKHVDAIVLGAGITGVSTAVYLRLLGLEVALVDRHHPGEEASGGNAGLIARNGFCPLPLPNRIPDLFDIFFKQSTAYHCDFNTLFRLSPWLRRYAKACHPNAIHRFARIMGSLRARALKDHLLLASKANAERFYRNNGWLQLYRSEELLRVGERERHYARIFGVDYQELNDGALGVAEPGLRSSGLLGVLWPESGSVSNPGAVVDALWRHFIKEGGHYLQGDALSLEQRRVGWRLSTPRKTVTGGQVVVALGAWSAAFASRFREKFPAVVTRGYNSHFRPLSGASLSRPVVDMEHCYCLTPVDGGIRLTTGFELVAGDVPARPVQLARAGRRARDIFPLGKDLTAGGWMGRRLHMPDSLPVIGASLSRPGIWYNFGYGTAGFALAPVCSRFLADMITGRTPDFDMAALSPARFLI